MDNVRKDVHVGRDLGQNYTLLQLFDEDRYMYVHMHTYVLYVSVGCVMLLCVVAVIVSRLCNLVCWWSILYHYV